MLAKIQSVWNSQTLLGMQDGIPTVVVSFFFFFLHLFFGHSIWHVGAKFPDQGSNPCPPQWKCGVVLTTGPPGKFLRQFLKVTSLSRVQLFATPWTVAYQAPQSMEFSRQEYWSGLPFPSPGDLPDPGIEPGSPTFQADALTSDPP